MAAMIAAARTSLPETPESVVAVLEVLPPELLQHLPDCIQRSCVCSVEVCAQHQPSCYPNNLLCWQQALCVLRQWSLNLFLVVMHTMQQAAVSPDILHDLSILTDIQF